MSFAKDAKGNKRLFKNAFSYSTRLSEYDTVTVEKTKKLRRLKVMKDDKYTAINTLHAHTVEFRLFAGTIDFSQMMIYAGFVDGLINYVKQASLDCGNVEEFKTWVTTKAAVTYPELATKLNPTLKKLVGAIPNFNINTYMARKAKKDLKKTTKKKEILCA